MFEEYWLRRNSQLAEIAFFLYLIGRKEAPPNAAKARPPKETLEITIEIADRLQDLLQNFHDVIPRGSMVKHKTGGPLMIVEKYKDGVCECSWFDGQHHMSTDEPRARKESFHRSTLTLVKNEPVAEMDDRSSISD